ncbi:MAG: N-acetylmuramoyl-L-alanine amidase [Clostridiales bacterium]|nr:N-acetylmuramoyl-L-alanine amidase [Clostridiales bacterium]MCF8022418.1 N-acetylmuramoyl-L-alanine amidase [Clostridiales bacterium]
MPVLMPVMKVNKKIILLAIFMLFIFILGLVAFISWRGERNVKTLSWTAANKVIVIDPGHGGKDPGVVEGTVVEKELTLEISRKLYTILSQAGAFAVLTRETDRALGSKKSTDLYNRVNIAKKQNADIFVSLHVNSFRAGPGEHGAQVFSGDGSEKSKVLAEHIQNEMVRILGNNKRKAKQADKYILSRAKIPAVIIETGFLTNPEECRKLQDPTYQGKIAYAIYAGIAKYFEEQLNDTNDTKEKDPQEVFSQSPYHIEAP